MHYTEETQRRMLAEKNRMDPPPDGYEWNLGWDSENGERAPERDMLVATAPPQAEQVDRDYGLTKSLVAPDLGMEPQQGYDWGPTGDGVHAWLVDAVLERWAGLDVSYVDLSTQPERAAELAPDNDLAHYRDRAARRSLRRALGPDATVPEVETFGVRELARLAALTVAEELKARDGSMPRPEDGGTR